MGIRRRVRILVFTTCVLALALLVGQGEITTELEAGEHNMVLAAVCNDVDTGSSTACECRKCWIREDMFIAGSPGGNSPNAGIDPSMCGGTYIGDRDDCGI